MSKRSAPCLLLSVAACFFAVLATATAQDAADTDDLVPPQIILESQGVPVYPPAAFAARFSGAVMVEATVLEDGTVSEVKVLKCTRPKVGFEQAAIDAVKKWRFEPGRKGDEAVEFSLKFRLNFSGEGVKPTVSAGAFTTQMEDAGKKPATHRAQSASSPTRSDPR